MRRLGYPPGWLEEAKISHSGINMLDSNGESKLVEIGDQIETIKDQLLGY